MQKVRQAQQRLRTMINPNPGKNEEFDMREYKGSPVPSLHAQTGNAVATMSSREIADLTVKQHQHVKRDIEKMLSDLGEDVTKFGHIYLDSMNRKQTEYRLDRDLTENLLLGYNPVLRRKVLARLRELEGMVSDPVAALSDPKQLRYLLLENVEKVLTLEATVSDLSPKAASYDFLTRTDGTMCITDAAKALGMRPKDMFSWLQQQKWIYRRAGNGHWVGYQDKVQSGLLDHRVEEVSRADGSTKITEQVRITSKGMGKLGALHGSAAA